MNSYFTDHRTSPSYKLLLALLVLFVCSLAAFPAFADEEEEPRKTRIVIMDVPDNGTRVLRNAINAIDDIDVRNQDWFYTQVEGRAFRTKGILERSRDLRWVMSGATIDAIIHVLPTDGGYTVEFYSSESAEVDESFTVPRSANGLSESHAQTIRQRLEKHLGIGASAPAPEPPPQKQAPAPQVTTTDPMEFLDIPASSKQEEKKPAAAQAPAAPQRERRARQQVTHSKEYNDDTTWLQVNSGVKMFRKDWSVTGTHAVMSYRSMMHPGLLLDVEAYPLELVSPGATLPGVYLSYQHSFDSFDMPVVDETDEEHDSLSISSLTVEGGLVMRLGPNIPLSPTSRWRVKLSTRHERFSVTENEKLPSTSLTSIVFGARMTYPVLVDGLAVHSGLDVIPIAFFGRGAQLFGERSSTYGFGSEVGLSYHFVPSLGVSLGYGFKASRSVFEGESKSEFVNTDSFDLQQGLNISVMFRH